MKTSYTLKLLAMMLVSVKIYAQVTYSFTSAGSTGRFGPSQVQLNTAYANSNLNGLVTSVNGIQQFTVPVAGNYRIEARGAQGGSITGGSIGGQGSTMIGEFFLNANSVVRIVVGQQGIGAANGACGGGGGSYVVDFGNAPYTNNAGILVVAGGGSGAGNAGYPGTGAPTTSPGIAGGTCSNAGQIGFGGGDAASCGNGAGGGGGFFGDGLSGSSWGSQRGFGFVNGANGGLSSSGGRDGGFGGGAGTHQNNTGGGAGGGYTGGGASYHGGTYVGGAGSSFNSGTNQQNTASNNLGDGMVILTRLCALNISVSAPNGTTSLCPGTSVTLTTDGVSGINWSTGGTGTTVVVSPTSTSIYSVSATTSANCIGYSQVNLIVNPNPTVNITSTVSVFCKGGSATLFGTGATTYSWNTGATTSSITVTPTSTTIYTVTGANQFSCVNTNTYQVNVFSPTVAISGPTAICLGQSATFNASSSNSYSWSTGWTGQMLTVSPNTSTSYSLSITSTSNNILCAAGTSVLLVVNPNPTVSASSQPANVCKGQTFVLSAGGASTYSWSTGAATSSVSTNESQPGIYTYTVTGTNAEGCSSTAQVQVAVNSCSGIQELGSARVQVYPNPSKGVVTIQGQKALQVEVLNALGQRIKTIRLGVENAYRAELNGLSSGLYFVQAEGVSTRLIVE